MRRIVLLLAVGLIVTLHAPAALAKGPSGGRIEGTGIVGYIEVAQPGELGQGTPMSRLVETIGFFDLTFGESKRIVADQPVKALGKSSITITWYMGEGNDITQDVYLDADGGPVTHVAPGQIFWDGWETVGGWMVVTGDLASPLIELGVDEKLFATKAGALTKKSPVVKSEAIVKSDAVAKTAAPTEKALAPAEKATPATAAPAASAPSTGASAGPGLGVVLVMALLLAAALGAGVWSRLRHPVPR